MQNPSCAQATEPPTSVQPQQSTSDESTSAPDDGALPGLVSPDQDLDGLEAQGRCSCSCCRAAAPSNSVLPSVEPPWRGGQNVESYTVRLGNTLGRIAREHGVGLDALIQANPQITNPDVIFPGQQIRIDGRGAALRRQTEARAELETRLDELRGSMKRPKVPSPKPRDVWSPPPNSATRIAD